MQKLNEFLDPGTGLIYTKNFILPAVKNGWNSAKNTFKIAGRKAKKNKKGLYKNIVKQLSKAAEKDTTLFGDVVRGSELARQATGTAILHNLPPLPTADVQSIQQTGSALSNFLTRGENKGKIANILNKVGINGSEAPRTMKKALKNPIKSGADFVGQRATASTLETMPYTSYNSSLFGITGPILDNSTIMQAFQNSGLSLKDFMKHLYTYNKAAYYNFKQTLPSIFGKFKDKLKAVSPTVDKFRPYSFANQTLS